MKVIKYKFLVGEADAEPILSDVEIGWNATNEETAKREAYNGEYEIVDDGIVERIIAPRNITKGEYVTVSGVLYKAIANIPNGEHIIVGQNAVVTTVEEQLYEMTKGE